MAKRRIYEVAREKGMSTHELAELLRAAGVEVTSNLSSVEEADVARVLSAPPAAEPSAGLKPASTKPAPTEPAPAKPESAGTSEPSVATAASQPGPQPAPGPAQSRPVTEGRPARPTEQSADRREARPPRAPRPDARPAEPRTEGRAGGAAPGAPAGQRTEPGAQQRDRGRPPHPGGPRPSGPPRRGPRPRGRGPRLEDLPTVVGPDVPLRKGVKAPGTVRLKGEEPPAPAPAPPAPKTHTPSPRASGPRPSGPPRVPRPSAVPEPSRPAGRFGKEPPRATPRRGKDANERGARPPKVVAADVLVEEILTEVEPEVEATAATKSAAAPTAQARVRRGDDYGGRRRVVIDSQAGRKGGRGSPRGSKATRTPDAEKSTKKKTPPGTDSPVILASGATVKDFSESLEIPAGEVIKAMMRMGELLTITQSLSDEAIVVLAEEFERQVTIQHAEEEESLRPEFVDDPADLVERAPVVTVMGHVDHGKTSLLDAIREAKVAAGEAGGITQHIGAYRVGHKDRRLTFIDTPGHEAFTAMRARGANMTDVAVIVVAANDGVMPQTTEAINHARAAGVPMLVALNKIDLEDSNPDRVKQQLAEQGLVPEDWGGDTVIVPVSAKKRINLDELMDMILLVADVQELKANPKAEASGIIIEAQLDPGRGPVATMLVQRGTLRVGDALVSGEAHGKVKAMADFRGRPLKEAGPSMPVQILGFNTVPTAGDFAEAVKDERIARQKAETRSARLRMEQMAKARAAATSLDDFFQRLKEGAVKELALVLKGDVAGSVEALEEALTEIQHPEVKVRVIHSGVGGINESDINLAAASRAVVIGFNVRPSSAAKSLAETEGVDIRTYRVIYKAIEDVQAALVGMLEPEHVESEIGSAEVRQLFRASKIGVIAGCYVLSGKLVRNAKVRVVRDGSIVHEGVIGSLRRFSDDAREVLAGFECGVHIDGFDDLKEGDVLEVYEIKEVARTR